MDELFFAIVSIRQSMKIVVILLTVGVPLVVAFPSGLGNILNFFNGGHKNGDCDGNGAAHNEEKSLVRLISFFSFFNIAQ